MVTNDHKEAAEIALSTTRKWLESNHASVDYVIFCTYENYDFDLYDDLMATVYFPVLNNYSTDNIDETPGSECSTSATNIDINHKLDTFTLDSSIPLGLLNRGENVCFFNCVVQTLYAIPAFRAFIQELVPINEAARAIKQMFEEILNSNESVRSSKYVRRLALTGYQFRHQYDAHECLLHILNKVYPTITDNCLFTISCPVYWICRWNY